MLTISQLANRVGLGPKTLRYYEAVGLLPAPVRSERGYRLYSEPDARRAELVRRLKALGMGLQRIREIVEFAGTGECGDFQGKLLQSVRLRQTEVERRMDDLRGLTEDLARLEAHLLRIGTDRSGDHTALQCSPETCTCLREGGDGKYR